MHATKPGGTREQQAGSDLFDRAALVRVHLATAVERVPEVLPYFDRLTEAVGSFGLCELHARSLDRSLALDVLEDRRPWLESQVARNNEAGIAGIARARETLKPLGAALDRLDLDEGHIHRRLEDLGHEFRLAVADWDVKGSDAAKLMEQLDKTADVVRSSGVGSLTDHLDRALDELVQVRQRPDRGAVDNIPPWKVVVLIGAFGWFIVAALVTVLGGSNTNIALLLVFIAFIHLVVFFLYC